MNPVLLTSIVAVAALVPGSHAPAVAPLSSVVPEPAAAVSSAGSFAQTGITSLHLETQGPVTIIDQTSFGTVDGTLSGSFEDDLKVVIKPNGTFSATFTLTVSCTVDGRQGVLTFQAADVGQIVGPTSAQFAGVAVIKDATGELAGLHGKLEIEGVVDLASGLSTYSYEGTLHANW